MLDLQPRISPPIPYHDRFEVNRGPSLFLRYLVAVPDMTSKDWNVSTTVRLASKVKWSPLELLKVFKPYSQKCVNISSCLRSSGWNRDMVSVRESNVNSMGVSVQ